MFFYLINNKIKTIAFLFCILKIHSQEKFYPLETPIFKDTIPQFGIPLKEVVLFQPLKFRTIDDLKNHLFCSNLKAKLTPRLILHLMVPRCFFFYTRVDLDFAPNY